MEPVSRCAQDFLVRWLAHLSERSVRLHYYLARLAINAPRSSGKPPPVIAAMVADVEAFAEDIRRRGRLAYENVLEQQDIHVAYKNCANFVRQFLKLHARLSHLPKDWVRSEVELFLNSIGSGLNVDALKLLGGKRRLLESYSVVTTPIYNFANLLDDQAHQGRILVENEISGTARDLLTIPAVEQHNTLFWPILIHELAHSIYDASGIGRDQQILDFIDHNIDRQLRDKIKDWWLEEIFCDLFAAAITGPIYRVSLTLFALFWVPDPIKKAAPTHPSPDVRLNYISAFLKRTNPAFMSAIEPELENLTTFRKNLDFEFERDEVQYIQTQIESGEVPTDDKIIALAHLVGQSSAFAKITLPSYAANVGHIQRLQDRITHGEFVGTSRDSATLPKPTIKTVNIEFEQYASALVEKPNSILDILTATACYQSRLLVDKGQYDPIRATEKLPQFPTVYIQDIMCGPRPATEFIRAATEFIHGADATAIKSLEGSELGRFYMSES